MRLKLLAAVLLFGLAVFGIRIVERRTRPDLVDEYGD